jgi:hypothetical protein
MLQAKNAEFEAACTKVASAAFNSAEGKARVRAAIFTALGATPTLEAYNACQLQFMAGTMASALARKGDNRTETVLIAHCSERLQKYAGFGGSRLKDGQLGFRTEDEELAKRSAAQIWSVDCREAGVTVPGGKSGSAKGAAANNAAGNNGKTGGATAAKGEAASDTKPVTDKAPIPKFANEKQAVAWSKREAATCLAIINANAGKVPAWLKSAIADFKTAVDNGQASPKPVKAAAKK